MLCVYDILEHRF